MTTAQNGWPVVTKAQCDQGRVRGVTFPNGVLKGDVSVVLYWVAEQWHTRVEPLKIGTCWGWLVKRIEGSSQYSTHSAGCAIDLNAPQHPMGVAASASMSAVEIAECHTIEEQCAG